MPIESWSFISAKRSVNLKVVSHWRNITVLTVLPTKWDVVECIVKIMRKSQIMIENWRTIFVFCVLIAKSNLGKRP